MLDRQDQYQLERNIEQRNNAVHRIISMMIISAGAVAISKAIDTSLAYTAAYVAVALCVSYSLFLSYLAYSYHRVVRILKMRAKLTEREFAQDLDTFLESVERKR